MLHRSACSDQVALLDSEAWSDLLRRFLNRPYGRVDRPKLKRMLLQQCIDSGVVFHTDRVGPCENCSNLNCGTSGSAHA